jgi:DNA-binding GntR family transcriptional regulator
MTRRKTSGVAMSAPKVPRGSYLYSDVARQIRTRIGQGVYEPGSKLPSIGDLVAEFGVSAITIRHALRELAHEGLVSAHQGLGVFVKEKEPIHRVLAGNPQLSIGDEITRAGYTARLQEVSSAEIRADAEIAGLLQVRRNARVVRHEKLTFADEQPVAFHSTIMGADLARRVREDLGSEFIFRVLDRHGIRIGNLRCEFGALAASEEHTRHLNVPAGFSLLRVRYFAVDADDKPIFVGTTIARADRFVFEVNLPPARKR